MQCTFDRFEGDYAVVEYSGRALKLPKVFLPVEAREGDVLDIIILLDDNETDRKKAEIKDLMEEVWEK